MRHVSAIAFITSGIAGAIIATSSSSDAFERRIGAHYCAPMHRQNNANVNVSGLGVSDFSFTDPVMVLCPIAEDTSLRINAVTQVNVHGFDGNNTQSISVTACSLAAFSNGGLCSGTVSSGTTFTGNFQISPTLFAWGSANRFDFPYLQVTLPPAGNVGASSVRGFFVAGG